MSAPATTTATTPAAPGKPNVAILGAGIAGLALAIGLIKRGVPVTVYEAADKYSTVGAGIGLGPNSLNAMDLIDSRFRQQYDRVSTANEKADFTHSVFDALYAEEGLGAERGWHRGLVGAPYFSRSSAHRKDLLEIMESFIPRGTVKFGKRAKTIRHNADQVVINFDDGDVVTVDALIGGDGVKGISRQIVLGDKTPELVAPTYSNFYIYRGLIPMDELKDILGTHAGDAKWFMAKGRGFVIYPISQGKEANMVVFVADEKPWANGDAAVACSKEDMLADLQGADPRLLKLLDYATPLRWPTWHHPNTPTYVNGRVCMIGDAAHASTPHQAAGAGQGLEDALVLSHLLSLVESPDQLDAAFASFDATRRPRAQKIVKTSAEAGLMYTWRDPRFGDDMKKIVENGNQRLHWIWQHDLQADVRKSEQDFFRLLAEKQFQPPTDPSMRASMAPKVTAFAG